MAYRRALLASAAGLTSVTLAGCSSLFGESTDCHYVDMLNGTMDPHVFTVTITDKAGGTLFETEYDLGPGKGDENRVVDGTPAEVTVVVDGAKRVKFPWAPSESSAFTGNYPEGCSEGTSTALTIWYGIGSEEEITPIYGCETVRNK